MGNAATFNERSMPGCECKEEPTNLKPEYAAKTGAIHLRGYLQQGGHEVVICNLTAMMSRHTR